MSRKVLDRPLGIIGKQFHMLHILSDRPVSVDELCSALMPIVNSTIRMIKQAFGDPVYLRWREWLRMGVRLRIIGSLSGGARTTCELRETCPQRLLTQLETRS